MLAVVGAAPAAAADATDGFLYGTVTTTSGSTYTGILRWDDEEAFWDDLFHSAKEDLPYARFATHREDRDSGDRWWEVFGRRMRVSFGDDEASRVFIARFGDIRSIRVLGGEAAELEMKSGSRYRVSGYANDVGGPVRVRDASLGDVEVEWRRIETITFAPTPSGVRPDGRRLYGTVTTRGGSFTGFVQWDEQECLTTDELDGDTEDGRVSIPMGNLASIERRSRSSSRVVLADGRELVLDGTNDVDDDNRGILVEDPRFGRVEIPWDEFDRLELGEPPGSGPGYKDYSAAKPLAGTVTTVDGTQLRGRLVYDLDESEGWEMLNGSRDGVDYIIPFERVASIVPDGRHGAEVTLRSGETIVLEDGQDVSDRNDGVLVLEGGSEHYVEWERVRRIKLD
jgi:hypothetical protein